MCTKNVWCYQNNFVNDASDDNPAGKHDLQCRSLIRPLYRQAISVVHHTLPAEEI